VETRSWTRDDLKACLFDFGGTLESDGVTWQDRFYGLYEKHGVKVDREAFRQAFYRADDGLIETGELKEARLTETLEAQAKRVWGALGLGNESRVLDAIVADFLEGMKWHVERNRSLLELLKERYELGIVSNFYGNLHLVCKDLGIQDLFQCLIDSSSIGAVKPDPRIFQAALDCMSIRPHEAVFVGDNPGRDMEGAKGLGMPHIWLAGEDVDRRLPCCPGDPVIPTLEALGPLLLEGRQAYTPREVA